MQNHYEKSKEKKTVALVSVLAAVFLTGSKLTIGLLTGSLGILSEALHSGLDLVAAAVTYFSVRISDKPADQDHNFGHGKVENLSALIETILLFITCFWIVYEAVHRLVTGKVNIEINKWSYIVVISSILIDISRSRALMKAAKKHNSQALEADALHFSTDIWSSAVVLLGLVCSQIGFHIADAIAALVVAFIVIFISFRLGKRSIDVLLDKAPQEMRDKIAVIIKEFPEVIRYHDVRIRNSGADTFIQFCIHVDPNLTIEKAHKLTDDIENKISSVIDRSTIIIHQEPESAE